MSKRNTALHSYETRKCYEHLRRCLGDQFQVCSDLTQQILSLPVFEDDAKSRELRERLQIEDARYDALLDASHLVFKAMYSDDLEGFAF